MRKFFGGIHPLYNKEMSTKTQQPMTVVPKQVIIPLYQHIGVPCLPLVEVGQRVLKGQKIGDGEGMCVPVHSSVSGVVVAIEPRPHPNGNTVDAVVIDNDFKDESVKFNKCDLSLDELDDDTVLHSIREAGIVGMGGAAFPGNVKAISAMRNVDTLIANACECEPYITADDTLLRIFPEQVFEGMMILHHVLSSSKMLIVIEDNKKEAINKLKELQTRYPLVDIIVLPTKYPQGAEKQLIQAVTGRQIPPGGLPVDVDCVVFNVSTYAAIYKAVRLGIPLVERIVTVTGEAVAEPQNFLVSIGTKFSDLIDAAGGLKDNVNRVINGGPMMGITQNDLDVSVVKATNCILCLPDDKNAKCDNKVCIRCGKCVEVCPMHLKPLYIARYAMAENIKELIKLNVTDCIECGSCSYTCPGKLPLVEKIRIGKKIVKESDK